MTIEFKTRGKVPTAHANMLLNGMLEVAKHPKVKKHLLEHIDTAGDTLSLQDYAHSYHDLRRLAQFDMCNDDSHPAYSPWEDIHGNEQPARERFIAFSGWDMYEHYYSDGVNDDHWRTVHNK